ncbi:hypothetical protein [Sneathiella limimaris]|uniref:hypothetical protein n=1 Tax=Sneathiella limimaris TaxID=1964213 RepID=UPI00146B1B03|nr:hypothetical protein [Sneathiella limimaris]
MSDKLPSEQAFNLIAVVDWSAAASPGPKRESPDRCWIGWSDVAGKEGIEYFRTRHDCRKRLQELARQSGGRALLAFDFPFGYPAGSSLGGGRAAATAIHEHLISEPDDANNRFVAASILNQRLSPHPGPFWGHPVGQTHSHLSRTKPPFHHRGFSEWRICEALLKKQGFGIMNVWQLLGQGSVGSQTLTGLYELLNLALQLEEDHSVSFWPFETNWDQKLDGIILGEVWPSLSDHQSVDHPIKDARQVTACRNDLMTRNRKGHLQEALAAPDLPSDELAAVTSEEGWIIGMNHLIA